MSNKKHYQPTQNINSATAAKVFSTIYQDIDLIDGYGAPSVMIIVGGSGTLHVDMVNGPDDGEVTFPALFDGAALPIQVKKIYDDSTATNVIILWNTYSVLK